MIEAWSDEAGLTPERQRTIAKLISELNQIMSAPGRGTIPSAFEKIAADFDRIQLIRGKNVFGDRIYAYMRISLFQIKRLELAIDGSGTFNLSEYGVIIAAGKGEPSAEVKRGVALSYPSTKESTPYLSAVSRGALSIRDHRYSDALVDLKSASESTEAVADDHTQLGNCYGRLGRWDEAILAHKRAFELEAKGSTGTDAALGLLQAFIVSERPADVESFVAGLVEKKWQPREEKTNRLNRASAMFYGFQAIAQRMLGKDATELEKKMRQYAALTWMRGMNWGWEEIDDWLKTTKLAPDRKAAIQKILDELKGIPSKTAK